MYQRQHVARADLVRHAARLIDVVAVDARNEVELDEVAVLRGAINGDEVAEALAQLGQLGLNCVVADLSVVDLDLEAVVPVCSALISARRILILLICWACV